MVDPVGANVGHQGAMLPRKLIVTVGTSLFESASWEPDSEPLSAINGYAQWCTGDRVAHLEQRRASPGAAFVKAGLEQALRRQADAEKMVVAFARGFQTPGRYSAEVATLIAVQKLMYPQQQPHFGEFLRAVYPEIVLVCGEGSADPSRVAALHLQAIFLALQVSSRLEELPSDLPRTVEAFARLLRRPDARVDLVVSGGYKAYAVLAGHSLRWEVENRGEWRLFYLHESVSPLIGEWHTNELGWRMHTERDGAFQGYGESIE